MRRALDLTRIASVVACQLLMLTSLDALAGPRQESSNDGSVEVDENISLRPAYDDCVSGGGPTTAVVLKCAYDEFKFQDRRLNDIYKTLMARLSVDEKAVLRNEERKWLADKKQRCALDEDAGTTDQIAAADCEVRETARRATDLEKRSRK